MKLKAKEIAVFAMLGTLMYVSKMLMQWLPNIHLLGVFIVASTVVYRAKALYPLYVYVFLDGLFSGFSVWWIPYLYVWTVLWAFAMILPKNMNKKIKPFVYMGISGLHGFLFGTLYAPVQAIIYGYDFKMTLAWIAAGFPFDITHGISNIICGTLICPLIMLLQKLDR